MNDVRGVRRTGEPKMVRGPYPGTVKPPCVYEVPTSALPPGAHGVDWRRYFGDGLKRGPVTGNHDGNKIIVHCQPDDEPKIAGAVDAAIDYANGKLGLAPLSPR